MAIIRRKKLYPSDIKSPIRQRDLSMYSRIGKIEQVYPEKGTCSVFWLDKPGIRHDVLLTQGAPKTFEIPEKGQVVLVQFDHNERARIIRYINLGHASRVQDTKSLPKLKEGDKLWENGGSYLYMKKNGDIVLSTVSQGYFILENNTSTLKSETVNWKVTTDAGILFFGELKRFINNGDGTRSLDSVTDLTGNSYTELRLKVVETSDGMLGLTGIESPFLDLAIGTFVDDEGDTVAKDDKVPVNLNKQLAVRLVLQSGVKIFIDKEGRLSIEGAKININNAYVDSSDSDIAAGLEENSAELGNKGQHAAREHDEITVPISNNGYNDPNHKKLTNLSAENIAVLQTLAAAIMSPNGPCSLNPVLLTGNVHLKGLITEGSENTLIGDN